MCNTRKQLRRLLPFALLVWVSQAANAITIPLTLTEDASLAEVGDTGATPELSFTAGSLEDAVGNQVRKHRRVQPSRRPSPRGIPTRF